MKDISSMIWDLANARTRGDIVNEWEDTFVENIYDKFIKADSQTVAFSSRQVEKIIQLHMKHCS